MEITSRYLKLRLCLICRLQFAMNVNLKVSYNNTYLSQESKLMLRDNRITSRFNTLYDDRSNIFSLKETLLFLVVKDTGSDVK